MSSTVTCIESVLPSISESNRCRRPDPVPSRVAYHHPLTEYEKLQAERTSEDAQVAGTTPKGRFSIPQERLTASEPAAARFLNGRHVGDVVYWVACLGGGCLLLLCATH